MRRIATFFLLNCLFISAGYGQSLQLNGVSSYVNLPNKEELQLKNFTIEAWIKIEGTGVAVGTGVGGFANATVVPIISKGSDELETPATAINYFVGYRASDLKLVADFEENVTSKNYPVVSNRSLPSCKWTHIAVSYSTSAGWKLYIDGVLDKTLKLPSGITPQSASIAPLSIGTALNTLGTPAGYFNGKIDEVRIWNIARTDADIANRYIEEVTTGPGLVTRYGFNEGLGIDALSNIPGLNGIITNGNWSNGFNQSKAMVFNGQDNYITFGVADGLNGTVNMNLSTFTIEGWIKVEGAGVAVRTGAGGINAVPIITKGRGESDIPDSLNVNFFVGVDLNKKLTADFEEGNGKSHGVISNSVIPDSIWTHIAVSYEPVTAVWKLYINGVLDKIQDNGSNIFPVSNSIEHAAIGSALNSAGKPQGYFSGKLDELRIWNLVRSDSEIIANYTAEIKSAPGLFSRWTFDEGCGITIPNDVVGAVSGVYKGITQAWSSTAFSYPNAPALVAPANNSYGASTKANLCVNVTDNNKDKMRVRFFGRKKKDFKKFTIVLLPDTQNYTAEPQGLFGGFNEIFKTQTNWIVKNRLGKNIVYVGQLGDCTEHGDLNEVEWKRADTSIQIIENAATTGLIDGIPYGICVGNHDESPRGNPTGSTTYFNKYFGASRFAGRSYYGGNWGPNNDNHYQLFSASGIDFLVISLKFDQTDGFNAPGGSLDWAQSIVEKYPTRKVIVLTHFVLWESSAFSTQAGRIYDRLKTYPNFVFMAGGHIDSLTGAARRTDTYNGNTVNSLFSDFQFGKLGGSGLLRTYEFDPAYSKVSVQTYSPFTNTYLVDPDQQFNMKMDLKVNPFKLVGEVQNVSSGSKATQLWQTLEKNADYEWYVEVFDGENTTTSPIWSFSTKSAAQRTADTSKSAVPKDQIVDREFTVYPNPNNTRKFIISNNRAAKENVTVNVVDALGRFQMTKTFVSQTGNYELQHHLSPGSYTLIITTPTTKTVKKIIVSK